MEIGTVYGLLVALVVGLTWLGRDHVSQKLALLLLLAWASTNLVVNYFGFVQAGDLRDAGLCRRSYSSGPGNLLQASDGVMA